MHYHVHSVMERDPLKIRSYNTPLYKSVYTLCVLIPALLAFALVFFLIFFMSPHGRIMRLYQRDIFEWNRNHYSQQLSQIEISYDISIAGDGNANRTMMDHIEGPFDSYDALGTSQIYNYQQSYFSSKETGKYLGSFKYEKLPVKDSDVMCLHLYWKDKKASDHFKPIEGQPTCGKGNSGIPFVLWRQEEEYLFCPTGMNCTYRCETERNGFYMNNTCKTIQILDRLCLKIDFKPSPQYHGGCFQSDEPAAFETAFPNTVYTFGEAEVAVRSVHDPYTVLEESQYNMTKDLSLFFWLSIMMVTMALVMTFMLLCCYCCIRMGGCSDEERAALREGRV